MNTKKNRNLKVDDIVILIMIILLVGGFIAYTAGK